MNQFGDLELKYRSACVAILSKCGQFTAHIAILAVFLFSSPLTASARGSCTKTHSEWHKVRSELSFRSLPQRNSPRYLELVQDLRNQVQKTNAYAILDLRSFISELNGLLWSQSFPKDIPSQINQEALLYSKGRDFFKEEAQAWQIEGVRNLQTWMRDLIADALPEVQLGKGYANVRKTTEDGRGLAVDKWHVDGGEASVTLAVQGVGTEILGAAPLHLSVPKYNEVSGPEWEAHCTNCKATTLPAGYAFIFFGSYSGAKGQFAPTIHRTPKNAGSRTLFVIRY